MSDCPELPARIYELGDVEPGGDLYLVADAERLCCAGRIRLADLLGLELVQADGGGDDRPIALSWGHAIAEATELPEAVQAGEAEGGGEDRRWVSNPGSCEPMCYFLWLEAPDWGSVLLTYDGVDTWTGTTVGGPARLTFVVGTGWQLTTPNGTFNALIPSVPSNLVFLEGGSFYTAVHCCRINFSIA